MIMKLECQISNRELCVVDNICKVWYTTCIAISSPRLRDMWRLNIDRFMHGANIWMIFMLFTYIHCSQAKHTVYPKRLATVSVSCENRNEKRKIISDHSSLWICTLYDTVGWANFLRMGMIFQNVPSYTPLNTMNLRNVFILQQW